MKQILRSEIILDDIVTSQQYNVHWNGYVMVLDTETFTDIGQKAKITMFTMFYLEDAAKNPNAISYDIQGMVVYDLSPSELTSIKKYCTQHNIKLYSKEKFTSQILFPLLEKGVMLVGHNINFDIGALCTSFSIGDDKEFRFTLCHCKAECEHPTIAIRNVKTKKYTMYIEAENYAPIVDTITLGNALLGMGASSLDRMLRRYGFTDDKKKPVTSYSEEYTEEFYEYAMHDVYLTSKLISAQYQLYLQHGLNKPFYTIMSEASVGKAYNEKLGIPPFRQAHTEVRQFLYNLANIAYYGGRSEVHKKNQSVQIAYLDFCSQYPLVNALIQSQKYLLANHITIEKCESEAQEFLNVVSLSDLQRKETWELMNMLVKIKTDNDILPCRIREDSRTIYGTQIMTDTISWYSMLDVVASKIRTGRTPIVVDAYRLVPHGQMNTNKINILGNKEYAVDLTKDDFFVKVINLRRSVKQELKGVIKELSVNPSDDLYHRKNFLDNLQLALKLMANSTSYGILVETREVGKQDIAGKYNAQPIGVHITSGARLLLAIAETLGMQHGIEHAFCDTDSFAYVKPDDMSNDDFYQHVKDIQQWFTPLSPYDEKNIFELEDVNYHNGKLTNLYALCISSKRYVLYNKLIDGTYRIRKLSEHGVTNFLTDYEISLPDDMPEIERDETGIRKYKPERYAMWYRAIEQVEKGLPLTIPIEVWSTQLALTQETISTPNVFNSYSYIPGIRPFSFFVVSPHSRFKNRKDRYYMPFIRHAGLLNDMLQAGKIYSTNTNEIVDSLDSIDTIQERLFNFFNHAESKSANGSETGTMQRRHVKSTDVEYRIRSGKKQEIVQESLWSEQS